MSIKTSKAFKAGLVLTGALISSTASWAADVTLRYNQWFPSQHWSQKEGLYKYFDEIEKVTEGRVKVMPSAKPLAPPTRNYQAVVNGIADIAWGPHGYAPGAFPLTEMVELPFTNQDAGVSSAAYWRLFEKYFQPAGMHDDVITLAVHVTSGGNIHMKEDAIATPDDFNGKKIRVQTSVVGDALKTLGAVPIAGSLSELREFLSRGIIDGTTLSDELLTGFKVDNYVEKITQIPGGIFTNSTFVIMNKAKWSQISESDRQAIMAISGEVLAVRMGSLWHENDVMAREQLKARLGDDYIMASEELNTAIDTAFQPIREAWLAKAEDKGVDGRKAITFYREEIEQITQ
ncbi:MAG: TRAP transporter substrate-binding protein [Oceanospirillales bacterium]|uniref:TRAP-type C4-dicarboxylate transport system substrate-binding protein n=1 Tax=Marinobacterium halophilum TaxID=267374 RepID=A0A2P8ERH7_9GAMM|nr:TRAP transporter substrate-binding protein [Marinobacterium halophilum]MBR9828500.1 TRAP transporter substrate-binding protein [Oceanospirillales bacterium]PSL12086.1 TRAP-type C4-dicarboxylate transport system substrate-binding protein [Marinobacterium halophilum]